jgi:hypothetical protein
VLLPSGGMQTLESAFSLLFALQVMRSELQASALNGFVFVAMAYQLSAQMQLALSSMSGHSGGGHRTSNIT